MGDIVGSERAPVPHELHASFNQVVNDHNRHFAASIASPLTITLGDEFQGMLYSLAHATPLVRSLRRHFLNHSINCRFVIGQAALSTPINRTKAWNMMGRGLARAREKLNDKKNNTIYSFSLLDNDLIEQLVDALGVGLTVIEKGWTRRQQADIWDLSSGQSASELARKRNVSVHSIYKVRASGNFEAYEIQWAAIDRALKDVEK
jgi:hypothetical protein